jgi:hypothetical protein
MVRGDELRTTCKNGSRVKIPLLGWVWKGRRLGSFLAPNIIPLEEKEKKHGSFEGQL